MAVLFTNNAVAPLSVAIDPAATVLQLQAGFGALYPQPVAAGEWFPVTLVDLLGNMEIVRCTARSGDTLTVTRAQENSVAIDFPIGSRVDHRLTAAALVEISYGGTFISDTPPSSPILGRKWFQSSTGREFVWYVDADSSQWIQTNLTGYGSGGGGGGGSGDDLETTPVAAIGSSVEQTIPEWLAGAPIIVVSGELFIGADHRGAWVHLTNPIGAVIYLPDNWLPGWSFGARQIGTGSVSWVPVGGASLQTPFTKADHSTILEQYEEVVFRVISNSDGLHAVWSFSGATA